MAEFISESVLASIFQKRSDWSHKGQFGKLLIIGGSEDLTGSPVFASMAAYRAGCDLVFVAAPRRAADVASLHSPLIMAHALQGEFLTNEHVDEVLDFADDFHASAV